uniref:WW domain-containing protein n=1 Tax=Alexandrium andersonii TaxID=327968 RepID=A0A7S2J9J2_9DINO
MAVALCSRGRRSALTLRRNRAMCPGTGEMSSIMQKLLGMDGRGEPPSLEEELAEIRRKEQEDLARLEEELDQRAPSEEDRRLQALQERMQMLKQRPPKRRQQRRPRPDLYGAAPAPANTVEVPPPWQVKLEAAEAEAAQALEVAQIASQSAEEAAETARQARSEAEAWAAGQRAAAAADPLTSGAWEAILDAGSNRWYYHNQETGVTTWDVPTMAERPLDPPAPWQLVPDYNSCQWYYHNTSTNETSWEANAS